MAFQKWKASQKKGPKQKSTGRIYAKAVAEHSEPDQVTVRRANSVQTECILSLLTNKSELISSTFANLAGLSSQVGKQSSSEQEEGLHSIYLHISQNASGSVRAHIVKLERKKYSTSKHGQICILWSTTFHILIPNLTFFCIRHLCSLPEARVALTSQWFTQPLFTFTPQ